ncbi:MAG: sodium/solute symporter [Salinivirgaceae bacterium]
MENITIPALDLVIIIVFLVGITLIGALQMRKKRETSDAFFLAGRNLNWAFIGVSLFAANISTIHLVGLAASGFNEGMVWGNFEWLAGINLILLALIFAPFYFKSKIQTLPEFLERRYDSRSRSVFAFIAILGALFVHIGMSLYAGAVIFERFFGINVFFSIAIISAITLTYYVMGGLKAVVITQAIQTGFLLFGATMITVLGVIKLGDAGILTFADLKEAVRPGALNMLHSNESIERTTQHISNEFTSRGFKPVGNSGLTWFACLLGYPVLGLWYWCSDQTIVQQVLAAKTKNDAQKGPIFAAFLKFLTPFIMVFPGIIAYIVFKDEVFAAASSAGVDKPGDMALSVLIQNLLPTGLIGLMSAALLAALMSTIAAALNSISTLVSVDIYKRILPKTPDKSLINIGRISALIIMTLAAFWSTQGDKFSSIFDAINRVATALSPPVATVLLFGVLYKRGTKEASFVTLVVGLVLGITAFVLDFEPISGDLIIINQLDIPFMIQAFIMFCICTVIYLVTSKLTPRPDMEQIEQYTWVHPLASIRGKIKSYKDVRVWVMILIILMITLYIVFS